MARNPLLQHFEYDHLVGTAKAQGQKFALLAADLDKNVPDNSQKEIALQKLIEARDAVARACKS